MNGKLEKPVNIAIACQGGGAHTAFTAGALSYLFLSFAWLEKKKRFNPYRLVGLSGTSGGAITAAMAWSRPTGAAASDPAGSWAEGARRMLDYWNRNKAGLNPVDKAPWWWGEYFANAFAQGASRLPDFLPRVEFPAQPFVSELVKARLRDDMRKTLGLPQHGDRIEGRPDVDLYVGAVDVLNQHGGARSDPDDAFVTFPRKPGANSIRLDELLASACIPELFTAQELGAGHGNDKRYFWDGLYSQNPPVMNFLRDKSPGDKPSLIWVIQINPSTYAGRTAPTTLHDIDDRRNELAGNLSLGQELRAIDDFNEVAHELESIQPKPGSMLAGIVPVTVAFIRLGSDEKSGRSLAAFPLDRASKMNRDPDFIDALIAEGVAMAHQTASRGLLTRKDHCMKHKCREDAIPHIHWPEPGELSELLAGTPDMMAHWRRLVGTGQRGSVKHTAATEVA